jgi:catechol 2,3-dioxygenase-like lactoylglutathione lyase family enzyme
MNTTTGINTLKAHLAINVTDAAASTEFYKKMFGIEPSKVRTGYAKFDIANPPLNFTLNEVPFGGAGALSHLGIQVATSDDVNTLRDRWAAAGLTPRDEKQTTCCYALQDKAWITDPDGNEWEAFVVLEDNLPEAKADGSSCCAPAFTNPEDKQQPAATACC